MNKSIFKIIGICIGLPILNLVISSTLVAMFVILNQYMEVLASNIYAIALIGDIITLLLIALIFLPSGYGIKDRMNIKKISRKGFFSIILLGIGLSILLIFLTNILEYFIPSYQEVSEQLASSKNYLFDLIIVIVLIPICEEILYRGIIFGYLRKNFDITIAILVQDLIFAIMHLNLVQSIYTFILGIVLALVYTDSDSILGNIIVHILFNLLGILIPTILGEFPNLIIIGLTFTIGIIFTIFSSIKMMGDRKKFIQKRNNRHEIQMVFF